MKKILCMILSIVMMVSMVLTSSIVSYAATLPTVTIDDITAEPSETVVVPIRLSGNIGITGALISIDYDEELVLTKISAGNALTDLTMTPSGSLDMNPVKIGFDGVNADSSNGIIAKLTFEAPSEAGTYNVSASCQSDDVVDNDLVSLAMSFQSGSIEVIEPIPEDAPSINVGSLIARAGQTVNVPISIENNPGIVSMLLDVSYDKEYLTLLSVNNGTVLNGATHDTTALTLNPYTLSWADDTATENNTNNGTIVTFEFLISEETPAGTALPVKVTYDNENAAIYDKDMNLIDFAVSNGKIEVKDYVLGDLNGDDKVNGFDRTILARYIAKWPSYSKDTFIYDAADVNADGNVNGFDRTILARHVAKWPAYATLPHTK